MSRERRLTEELGWLKVLFAAVVAVIGSLVSWLGSVTDPRIIAVIITFVLVALVSSGLIMRVIYKRLAELDQL